MPVEQLPKRYSARVNIADRKSIQHIKTRRQLKSFDETVNAIIDENLQSPGLNAFLRKGEEIVTVAFYLYPSIAERVQKIQHSSGATFSHILRSCIRTAMEVPA